MQILLFTAEEREQNNYSIFFRNPNEGQITYSKLYC